MERDCKFYDDPKFNNPGDGMAYQTRILAAQTFIEPTIADELIAHSLGVQLVKPKRTFWGK